MEYNLAASENRDAMVPPKMGTDLQFSRIGRPEWIPLNAYSMDKV
jgi:hypothetical protein